jgi:hypothetical protein
VSKLLVAVPAVLVLIALPAPSQAQVEPVVPLDPFPAAPDTCVVPAADPVGVPCSPFRAPERSRGTACNLPVIYLGGRPGPCPDPQAPPEGQIVPLELSR